MDGAWKALWGSTCIVDYGIVEVRESGTGPWETFYVLSWRTPDCRQAVTRTRTVRAVLLTNKWEASTPFVAICCISPRCLRPQGLLCIGAQIQLVNQEASE